MFSLSTELINKGKLATVKANLPLVINSVGKQTFILQRKKYSGAIFTQEGFVNPPLHDVITQITLSERKSNITKFKMKASKRYLKLFEEVIKYIIICCAKIGGVLHNTVFEDLGRRLRIIWTVFLLTRISIIFLFPVQFSIYTSRRV